MGKVISSKQSWEIETIMDYDFMYHNHRFEIIGAAKVEYTEENGEIEQDVYFPNPKTSPELALRIRIDGVEVPREVGTPNGTEPSELFVATTEYLVSVLTGEISPDNTDLCNEDFEDYSDEYLEDLLDDL